MNDFTAALGNLQAEQRRAAQRGKDCVARVRAASRLSVRLVRLRCSSYDPCPPSPSSRDLILSTADRRRRP